MVFGFALDQTDRSEQVERIMELFGVSEPVPEPSNEVRTYTFTTVPVGTPTEPVFTPGHMLHDGDELINHDGKRVRVGGDTATNGRVFYATITPTDATRYAEQAPPEPPETPDDGVRCTTRDPESFQAGVEFARQLVLTQAANLGPGHPVTGALVRIVSLLEKDAGQGGLDHG